MSRPHPQSTNGRLLPLLLLVLLVLPACPGDDATQASDNGSSGASGPEACVPGMQIECACPGAPPGAQVCTPDGAGFGPCMCDPTMATTGETTSTSDDSGTSTGDDSKGSICGDGIVNATAGEQCDDAGESATCDVDCTLAACGDGVVNVTAGEACDDGGESATCDTDCTPVECGDSVVNDMAGEVCDDGNTDDGDDCSATCQLGDCSAIAWLSGTEPSAANAMSYPTNWTMEGWVMVPALPVPDAAGDYGIVVGIDATEQCPGPQHWGVQVHATGVIDAFLGSTYTNTPSAGAVTPGQWLHFALQNDGGGNGSLWVNGTLAHTSSGGTPTWTAGCPLRVGNFQGSDNHFLGAQLASLRFSDTARYTVAFTPELNFADDADTLWLFALNEGAGTSASDASGSLVMQLNGATWVADGPGCGP